MEPSALYGGLNEQQLEAVRTTRGPLCILAGAGTGKTTTITSRIASQVATGAFHASEVLAVTFTDKAAGEMRARLGALGVDGVRARTFHSAAAAQLHALGREPLGGVLPSKALALRRLANSLPKPYRFRPAGDLASEIERARNRRVPPERYLESLGDHSPPIPADLMSRIYSAYERGKRARGLVDFEDMIELAIRLFEDDPEALARFRSRYASFTVDEYQDVNLLQQTLLERWLDGRDDLCVVGDDHQSIYGFNGATPRYLLTMSERYDHAKVVRLEDNYRSTPEVLETVNRVARALGGATKILRATLPSGPPVTLESFPSCEAEVGWLCDAIIGLHERGVAYDEIAVLYRVNSRSEDYESALLDRGIPYSVRDGAFLQRAAARRMLRALERSPEGGLSARVRALADADGFTEGGVEGVGEREATRQGDLARLVRLAREFDGGEATGAEFAAHLRERYAAHGRAAGVNLLTLHRAKGLEFDAVFMPRLQEGELPFRRASGAEALDEERRLFYVGLTRARRWLALSWSVGGRAAPSPFLDPLLEGREPTRHASAGKPADDVVARLRSWRLTRARRDGVPPYVVLHDSTLVEIARRNPKTPTQLGAVSGIGPAKLERYANDILATLATGD